MDQYNGKGPVNLVHVSKPLITVITAILLLLSQQRLAIELSRNHPPTAGAAATTSAATPSVATGGLSDIGHVALLEQSLDSMEDDDDQVVTKKQGDTFSVTPQGQCVRPRATVHTALDVETASGNALLNEQFDSIPHVHQSQTYLEMGRVMRKGP